MSKPEYPRVGLMTDGGQARGRPLDTVISLDLAYGRLLVLADGVGAGESPTAAEIAVDNLSRLFREQQPDFNMERAVPRFLQYAMQETNREVFKAGQLTASPTEFGASVVLTLIIDTNVYVGYCGSARMVVLRNGAATRITKDYSTLGASSDGKAAAKIAKPMGFDPELSPAVFAGPIQLRTGDLFLLCSDGLYEWVEDGEMGSAAESAQAEEAVVELVNLAKERGSADSVSVVIYQTEGPAIDTADYTEGVLVAEPDQSPTEPAAAMPIPTPPRRSEPPASDTAGKKLPWLVIGAAGFLVFAIVLLLWAPWSSDEATPEKPVVAQADQKAQQAATDKAGAAEEALTDDDEGMDPEPGKGLLGGLSKKGENQLGDQNEPPSGGRVIEVALPIPTGKEEGAQPYVAKGKKVKDPSKLGGAAAAADEEVEAPAAEEQPGKVKSGGTQAEAEKPVAPAEAVAKVAVKPATPDGEDDWPEETDPAKVKKAEADAKKLAAAEAKKAALEPKMTAAEKKKAEKARKKAEKEAKKKAEAEAKKAAAEAKKAEAEAKKAAAAAKKAEAEAKKAAAAAKKGQVAKKEVPEEETTTQAKSSAGCNSQGLKGKNANALQKVQDALKKGKDAARKSDGQIAAEQYQLVLWHLKHNKEAKARCSAAADELKADLANLYIRVTEYQAKKKLCKAARGRAKDAAMFGATDAQLKKALGECYAKKFTEAAPAPKPAPAPKKSSTKEEDMEP